MPGLSGSERGYLFAVAAACRADSTRAAFFTRDVVQVSIRGTVRAGVEQSSIRIDLNTGVEPNRCSFDIKGGYGFVPQVGDAVSVSHGTLQRVLFSGVITEAVRVGKRAADPKPTYRCDAAGHIFEMGTARVYNGFRDIAMSPRSIVGHILSASSPSLTGLGFTADGIAFDLPVVSRYDVTIYDDIPTAIDGVFKLSGSQWWVDNERRIVASNSIVGAATFTNSSDISRVSYSQFNASRMFTRVEVLGATAETVWDASNVFQPVVPLSVNSALGTYWLETSSLQPYLSQDDDYAFGVSRLQGSVIRDTTRFPTGPSYVVLPVSPNGNSILVGTANVNSVSPLWHDSWYKVNDRFFYVNSVLGPVSTVANSPYGTNIIYAYWVDDSGPGGLGDGLPGSLSLISGCWNLTTGGLDSSAPEYTWATAGTKLQVLVSRVNTPGVNVAASLFGGTGVINKTIEDTSLNPVQCAELAAAALEKGDPSQWRTLEFVTREHVMPGEILSVALTSLSESGASSIAGTFTAHDITIGGFGRLTNTKGPERTVRAGTGRRPTLWQILQGD